MKNSIYSKKSVANNDKLYGIDANDLILGKTESDTSTKSKQFKSKSVLDTQDANSNPYADYYKNLANTNKSIDNKETGFGEINANIDATDNGGNAQTNYYAPKPAAATQGGGQSSGGNSNSNSDYYDNLPTENDASSAREERIARREERREERRHDDENCDNETSQSTQGNSYKPNKPFKPDKPTDTDPYGDTPTQGEVNANPYGNYYDNLPESTNPYANYYDNLKGDATKSGTKDLGDKSSSFDTTKDTKTIDASLEVVKSTAPDGSTETKADAPLEVTVNGDADDAIDAPTEVVVNGGADSIDSSADTKADVPTTVKTTKETKSFDTIKFDGFNDTKSQDTIKFDAVTKTTTSKADSLYAKELTTKATPDYYEVSKIGQLDSTYDSGADAAQAVTPYAELTLVGVTDASAVDTI